MFQIRQQSNKVQYGLYEFVCDDEKDLPNLPIDCTPGSTVLVINTADIFMLNNKHEWINLSNGKITDYTLPKWNGGEY